MTPEAVEFLACFEQALAQGHFVRLVLAKPRVKGADLTRVTARPITLKGDTVISVQYSHATKDITKNLAPAAAPAVAGDLIETAFDHAHLFTAHAEWQLLISRRGPSVNSSLNHH